MKEWKDSVGDTSASIYCHKTRSCASLETDPYHRCHHYFGQGNTGNTTVDTLQFIQSPVNVMRCRKSYREGLFFQRRSPQCAQMLEPARGLPMQTGKEFKTKQKGHVRSAQYKQAVCKLPQFNVDLIQSVVLSITETARASCFRR